MARKLSTKGRLRHLVLSPLPPSRREQSAKAWGPGEAWPLAYARSPGGHTGEGTHRQHQLGSCQHTGGGCVHGRRQPLPSDDARRLAHPRRQCGTAHLGPVRPVRAQQEIRGLEATHVADWVSRTLISGPFGQHVGAFEQDAARGHGPSLAGCHTPQGMRSTPRWPGGCRHGSGRHRGRISRHETIGNRHAPRGVRALGLRNHALSVDELGRARLLLVLPEHREHV